MKRFASLIVATTVVAAGSAFALTGGVANAKSAHAASTLPTLTLALNGKSVTVGGSLKSGAVNVVTTVTKEAQGEPTLVLLKPGATAAQAFAAVNSHGGDLNYLDPYGSIVFDATVNKGTSSAQTVLASGNYVALDTVSNAAVPPHTEFTITQSASPAALPKPGATVSAIEFGFRGASTLHDGELVRFENDGFLVHMIAWIEVKNTLAAKRLTALLLAGKNGKAMAAATATGGFAGPLSSGGLQQLVVTEKPGVYVLACFMNTQDGRLHTQLGMERTIRIVK